MAEAVFADEGSIFPDWIPAERIGPTENFEDRIEFYMMQLPANVRDHARHIVYRNSETEKITQEAEKFGQYHKHSKEETLETASVWRAAQVHAAFEDYERHLSYLKIEEEKRGFLEGLDQAATRAFFVSKDITQMDITHLFVRYKKGEMKSEEEKEGDLELENSVRTKLRPEPRKFRPEITMTAYF